MIASLVLLPQIYYPICYSQYTKEFYSLETVLLKGHSDITLNIDQGKVTALTLIDLSAAFDSIGHNMLVEL